MKIKQTECSETSAYKIQTLGNYPEENVQQSLYSLTKNFTPSQSLITQGYRNCDNTNCI